MFDCGCHDNDTSDAPNMAFFVHSPSKPTTTQKYNGAFKNLLPTLLHFLQESLLMVNDGSLIRKRRLVFSKRQTINYLKLARSTVFALIQNAFKVT